MTKAAVYKLGTLDLIKDFQARFSHIMADLAVRIFRPSLNIFGALYRCFGSSKVRLKAIGETKADFSGRVLKQSNPFAGYSPCRENLFWT